MKLRTYKEKNRNWKDDLKTGTSNKFTSPSRQVEDELKANYIFITSGISAVDIN